jgi:hypothetical protein
MYKNLVLIKRHKIYKFFLMYLFKPFYDLVWEFLINFEGKILYLKWFSQKRNFIDLHNNDTLLVEDNINFIQISNKIKKYIEENLLETSRKELLYSSINTGNPTNSGTNLYSQNLFNKLDPILQKEIFNFAHSDVMLSTVSKYLKVFPILDKISVGHNIPKNSQNIRGAMLWHKDDFGYKSMDLFMAISEIDEDSGPLKVIKKRNKFGVFAKNHHENKNNNSKGERGKIHSNYFENRDPQNVLKLVGKPGTTLFVDSFTVYHRGGHCLSKDRLMFRLSYQTPDSIRVNYSGNEFNKIYNSFKNTFPKNKFLKYLYEKRPSKFMIKLREYLSKLYRYAHIKIS